MNNKCPKEHISINIKEDDDSLANFSFSNNPKTKEITMIFFIPKKIVPLKR